MQTTSLVTFKSKCIIFEEGKMEKAPIPDPSTIRETSTVTEEQIQSLADHGLLRPKARVDWRSAAGEEFPTEGTDETVVFLAHIERGFCVLVGDYHTCFSKENQVQTYMHARIKFHAYSDI
jgi:hypothetical protein